MNTAEFKALLDELEDAAFVAGYRAGHFDGESWDSNAAIARWRAPRAEPCGRF